MSNIEKAYVIIPIAFYIFMFAYASSLGGSYYVYLVEVVPSIGVSLASSIRWIVAMIIGFFSTKLYESVGLTNMYIFLFSVNAFCVFLFWGFSVEAHGFTDEQTRIVFLNKKFFR